MNIHKTDFCEKHITFGNKFIKEDCPFCQLEKLDGYFTSGNSISVERATILAKNYWEIRNKQPSNGNKGDI